MATVKCYQARSNLKVGEFDTRIVGDLVPEALEWPNVDIYVRSNQIEVVWLDDSIVKDWEKKHAALLAERAVESSTTDTPAPAKKVAAKKIIRRNVKEKSDGRIEEVNV